MTCCRLFIAFFCNFSPVSRDASARLYPSVRVGPSAELYCLSEPLSSVPVLWPHSSLHSQYKCSPHFVSGLKNSQNFPQPVAICSKVSRWQVVTITRVLIQIFGLVPQKDILNVTRNVCFTFSCKSDFQKYLKHFNLYVYFQHQWWEKVYLQYLMPRWEFVRRDIFWIWYFYLPDQGMCCELGLPQPSTQTPFCSCSNQYTNNFHF